MTAKKKDTINIAFELSFFKELLKALSLEQMQVISEFLNQEIHSKSMSKTKKLLWEKLRQIFDLVPAVSMRAIYKFIAKRKMLDFPLLE